VTSAGYAPRADRSGQERSGADKIRSSFVPHEGRSSFMVAVPHSVSAMPHQAAALQSSPCNVTLIRLGMATELRRAKRPRSGRESQSRNSTDVRNRRSGTCPIGSRPVSQRDTEVFGCCHGSM
jgi:hypothetical protein